MSGTETSTTGAARLTIVCGLPGAGKTTHAKQIEERSGAIRFCPDEWMRAIAIDFYDVDARDRIEALQWRLAQPLLARGVDVIIEWGTWARAERDTLRLGARTLGASVALHHLSAPIDVLYERCRARGAEHPAVRREDLVRWAELFEAPDKEERALFDEVLDVA